jgi:hypothetical protein
LPVEQSFELEMLDANGEQHVLHGSGRAVIRGRMVEEDDE